MQYALRYSNLNDIVDMCEKRCDRSAGCQSIEFCQGAKISTCYLKDKIVTPNDLATALPRACFTSYRTCTGKIDYIIKYTYATYRDNNIYVYSAEVFFTPLLLQHKGAL